MTIRHAPRLPWRIHGRQIGRPRCEWAEPQVYHPLLAVLTKEYKRPAHGYLSELLIPGALPEGSANRDRPCLPLD